MFLMALCSSHMTHWCICISSGAMFVYHSCFPHTLPLSTWPKAHRTVSSHCRASQWLLCTSLTLIIVACPATTMRFPCTHHCSTSKWPHVHPSHIIKSNGPSCQIQMKARMDHHVGRHTNMMGSLGMSSGSRHASCLDKVAVLAWVADVPSMHHHVGGRHAPAVGCIAAAQAWPLLIKVYGPFNMGWGMCLPWPLWLFFFLQEHCGTGGFSGRAIMWPLDVVLLDMPSSHSHSLSALGIFGRSIMQPRDVVLLDMPSSHSHSHFTSAWFAFSPLHRHLTYPFPTTRSGSASLTSST